MSKRICLITPGHISSNPRLIKEAIALSQAGLHIHLIFTQYVDNLVEYDKKILSSYPLWTYDCLNWTKTSVISKINRLKSGLKQRIFKNNNITINRNFSWQLKKALAVKADLYIAHNLGALPVATLAASKNKAKCGFDAEDLHRHQLYDDVNNTDVLRTISIEEKYIPQLNYMTAASSQISEKYRLLFNRPVNTILNVFPKTLLGIIHDDDKPLRIFWFSQTIGPNRGLETAIEGIGLSGLKVSFHLLGNITDDYKKHLYDTAKKIKTLNLNMVFHPTIFPDDIFIMAAQFDIGLASEPGFCINNKIALSNKLFTYIQSGLAVVASDTLAQSSFMNKYPQTGFLFNNAEELAHIISQYHHKRDLLLKTRKHCYQLGQTTLNWEKEAKKFLSIINSLLNVK